VTNEELICVIAVPLAFIGYYAFLLLLDVVTRKRPPRQP